MYEWVCHHDLVKFWQDKCLLGACDDVDELHKILLGECVDLHESHVCPGDVIDLADFTAEMLGPHERIFGDRILGMGHLGRAFRGSRCLKVAHTFICDDDLMDILKTGCQHIHAHDANGHHAYNVCDEQLADLLEGSVVTLDNGTILKAVYSSEFTDLGDICIQTANNHYTCWDDIDNHYHQDEECALYGDTWLCYMQIRHAWQHGECLSIDSHPVCEHDFYDVAQRKCVTLEGVEYCPRAFGVREFHPELFDHEMSDLEMMGIHTLQ